MQIPLVGFLGFWMTHNPEGDSVVECGSPLPLWKADRRTKAAEGRRTPRPGGGSDGSWEAIPPRGKRHLFFIPGKN